MASIKIPGEYIAIMRNPEREALLRYIRSHPEIAEREWQRTLDTLYRVMRTNRRFERKAALNFVSDAKRRKLVGARVPLALYERCQRAAQARGVSLYAWVVQALEQALDR